MASVGDWKKAVYRGILTRMALWDDHEFLPGMRIEDQSEADQARITKAIDQVMERLGQLGSTK